MSTKLFFEKIGKTLQRIELFERPKKKIPGKWQMYEYFVDKEEELVHQQADDLKANDEYFVIEFTEDNFIQSATLPLSFIQDGKNGKWAIRKNFILLIDESNFRNNVEYQFAFEKGNLKLLKKDAAGKIEFFGFFNKLNLVP